MKRIELKKVSIVFLTMLLFLSIQIPAYAADTDTTVKIPVEQVFNSQNKDASDEFMYALLTDQSDAPMPDGSSNQRYVWNMKGNIATEITMNIRNAGQYHYKICQITEKKENYSYDERNYDITVEAFYNADNQLKVIPVVETQDGEKVSGISFKNSYTWLGKDKICFLVADFVTAGNEMFLDGYYAPYRKPIKSNDIIKGKVKLRVE